MRVYVSCVCEWEQSDRFMHKYSFFFREFAKTIPRPFSVRYNPYTQSVDVLKDRDAVQRLVSDIKYEIDTLQNALPKMI